MDPVGKRFIGLTERRYNNCTPGNTEPCAADLTDLRGPTDKKKEEIFIIRSILMKICTHF